MLADQAADAANRCEAALRLGKKGGDNAFWALARSAFDPDFWIRTDVVRALSLLEDRRSFSILLHLLGDPDDLVRYETVLAVKYLLSRFDVSRQYDLLMQYEEGSARALGAFHATARPTDINLSVLGERLLSGKGLDLFFDVDGKKIGLHDCNWSYEAATRRAIRIRAENAEAGIRFYMTILCAAQEFTVTIEGEFDRAVEIHKPMCDVSFVDRIAGRVLLPTNGMAPGPTRRFTFGNDLIMRTSNFRNGPKGITLDITQSPLFRQVLVNSDITAPLVQLKSLEDNYLLGPGRFLMLRMGLRPHPSDEDFQNHRQALMDDHAVLAGTLTARAVGSAFRIEDNNGLCILDGFGLFTELIDGDAHHTTFNNPLSFERIDEHALGARFTFDPLGLVLKLRIHQTDENAVGIEIESLEMEKPCDRIRIGLLISRKYSQWKSASDWNGFNAGEKDSGTWTIAADGALERQTTLYFRAISGLDIPPISVTMTRGSDSMCAFGLRSTDSRHNCRSVEFSFPGKKNPPNEKPVFPTMKIEVVS